MTLLPSFIGALRPRDSGIAVDIIWTILSTCFRSVYGNKSSQNTGIMSAYYSNILPPANLPNGTSQEPFLNHDGKYDSSFYGTGGAQGVGSFDSSDPQHPGYPRFPPYDRLDIRTLGGVTSKAGYAAPAHSGSTYSGVQSFQSGHNGQYGPEDLANCKPGVPQEGSPASMVSAHGGSTAPHPGMVSSHFGGAASQLGSVVNGVQAQNIPIYPWMRPMNGGK